MRQKWVFAHYLMCSLNQYFLSTPCVQGLMLSTVVEDTHRGSAQPLRSTNCRAVNSHPCCQESPWGCRLKADSKLLSGGGLPASGSQAAGTVLGAHRTLGYSSGLRPAGGPAGDSGPLAGPGTSPQLPHSGSSSTAFLSIQAGVSHLSGPVLTPCLPAIPAVCLLWSCPHSLQKGPQHKSS